MVIEILDHVERCYSNDDGNVIFLLINKAFNQGEHVTVSFSGVNSITSSFTNSAFIELIKEYDISYVKQHLSFVNSNKSINTMIKDRFDFFSAKQVAFA
ncbi:STAS-like domain-containing protein [Lysinibacillus fusiformis]|uniref:STAS-like domain-containing protein n=1 Tax=Lysinibacillus fusiformis TaxID=28031 RepID=UPI0037AE60D4